MLCWLVVDFVSHTGEAFIHHFEELLALFSITNKVDRVITDNPCNMKRAFHLLDISDSENQDNNDVNEDYDDEEEFLTIETDELSIKIDLQPLVIRPHSCLDHTLQLVVKDGLKNATQIQQNWVKFQIVPHVRHSSQACDLFENDPKLQMANVNRWNSQLTMIKSLLNVPDHTW